MLVLQYILAIAGASSPFDKIETGILADSGIKVLISPIEDAEHTQWRVPVSPVHNDSGLREWESDRAEWLVARIPFGRIDSDGAAVPANTDGQGDDPIEFG